MGCRVTLGEICTINASQYSTKEAWTRIQYLDTGNVTRGAISELQQLDPLIDKVPSRARRKVKPNSIVYSMVRPNQEHYALLKKPPTNMLVSTGFSVIDANENRVLPSYLYYALTTNQTTRGFQTLAEQSVSTYPTLSSADLLAFEIPLPSLNCQQRIAAVLECLDEKIATNTKLNGYLEELLLAKCADLENAVEESCTVGDYCKRIYSGGTPSTKIPSYWNGTLPWLSSGETRARFIIGSEKTITPEGIEGSSTKLANRGSIVMASAGQGFTRGQTSMLLFDTYVNQSVVVMVPEEKCGSYLLFALAARYEELRAWSDSTSTRGSLSGKILRRFALPCLTKKQLERFESLANPLIRVIESNLRESKSLAELRDALLPKLMSGEIDVSKVDLTQLNSHLVERWPSSLQLQDCR